MIKQIILTKNEKGELASFAEADAFALYQKREAKWQQTDAFEPSAWPESIRAIRDMIAQLSARFAECRVIVSRKVSGIAYQTLDRAGFQIFEADAATDRLLDDIMRDVLAAQALPDAPPMQPVSPGNDGNYVFDLVRLQKARPDISSKQALMAFMQHTPFVSLELTCDHIPPWMEEICRVRGLKVECRNADGQVKAVIQNGCMD